MAFWKGFAQAIREEDQQQHERELFQEKVNAQRDTEWLQRRLDRQQQAMEEAMEAENTIRRGAVVLGGDLDAAAALYQSGQLGDIITAYDDAVKSENLNQGAFTAIAGKVRQQMGDEIEEFGSRMLTALRSNVDMTTPEGQSEALLNASTGGRTVDEIAASTPPLPTGQGSAPAFGGLDYNATRNESNSLAGTNFDIVAKRLQPLLAGQLNFSTNPETGSVTVTGFQGDDVNGRRANRLLNNAVRKYGQLTGGPSAMDPTEAASLIYDFVDYNTDPDTTPTGPNWDSMNQDILNLDGSAEFRYAPAPTPRVETINSDLEAQELLGDSGPTVTPAPMQTTSPQAPVQAPEAPQVRPNRLTFSPDQLDPTVQTLDDRETSSWADRVRNTARER